MNLQGQQWKYPIGFKDQPFFKKRGNATSNINYKVYLQIAESTSKCFNKTEGYFSIQSEGPELECWPRVMRDRGSFLFNWHQCLISKIKVASDQDDCWNFGYHIQISSREKEEGFINRYLLSQLLLGNCPKSPIQLFLLIFH